MKFTVKLEKGFKTGKWGRFEHDNKHDSVVLGIPDERVLIWREAGWVEVEGYEPGPEARPGARRIQPKDIKHAGLAPEAPQLKTQE